MVGPNGFEPSTSSVSRKRSRPTELRASVRTAVVPILMAARDSGNVNPPRKPRLARSHQRSSLEHSACQLPTYACGGENHLMRKDSQRARAVSKLSAHTSSAPRDPFSPGSMVVVTLGSPRDKFWGMVLALGVEGLSLRGIELASFEDLILMVKDGEPVTPAVVFFPMHRIERIELDLPDGNLPSLCQRFSAQTGIDPVTTLSAFGNGSAVPAVKESPAKSGRDPA